MPALTALISVAVLATACGSGSERPANATSQGPAEICGNYVYVNDRHENLNISPNGLTVTEALATTLSWTWIASSGPNSWTFGCDPPVDLNSRSFEEGPPVSGGSIVRHPNGNITIGLTGGTGSRAAAAMARTYAPEAPREATPTPMAEFPRWLRGTWETRTTVWGCEVFHRVEVSALTTRPEMVALVPAARSEWRSGRHRTRQSCDEMTTGQSQPWQARTAGQYHETIQEQANSTTIIAGPERCVFERVGTNGVRNTGGVFCNLTFLTGLEYAQITRP